MFLKNIKYCLTLNNKLSAIKLSQCKFTTTVEETIKNENDSEKPNKKDRIAVNNYEHNLKGLMEFFDSPKNWCEEYIQTGRSWKVEELRNKSNSDLHKLWYVLLKERNMLLTMEYAHHQRGEVLPSEERVYKVEDSMKNLETVVKERNKAYWQLEVDENETGMRPVSFRKDIYGRYRWISCSEHLVPYVMNKKWKRFNGLGKGKNIIEFSRRYKEQLVSRRASKLLSQAFEVRQILRRFPNVDKEVLKKKYPYIDIDSQENLMDEDLKKHKIIDRFFKN